MEKLSIYALFIFLFLTSCYSRQHTAAWHAEEFKNQGKYQEAIDKYKEHIETVSKNEKINKDYNASFYNLLIGDCY
ncbi:MAG: hypothetical protein KBC84_07700, partial [Proteobacteria bacterium]|nr:hypothetical protein [Pseudomonadota bacterium]